MDDGPLRQRPQFFAGTAGDAGFARLQVSVVEVDAALGRQSVAKHFEDVAAGKPALAQPQQHGNGTADPVSAQRQLDGRRRAEAVFGGSAIDAIGIVWLERASHDADGSRTHATGHEIFDSARDWPHLVACCPVGLDAPGRAASGCRLLDGSVLAEALDELPGERVRLVTRGRDQQALELAMVVDRLDEENLCTGHVVEAGYELRFCRYADALCGAGKKVGRIDASQRRDEPLVLTPDAHDELRAGAVAERARAAQAGLEVVQGRVAVADVAVGAFQHRGHTATLDDGIVDSAHGHAHGQPSLGVVRHAWVRARVVQDPAGEGVDAIEPCPDDPGRSSLQELRQHRSADAARGDDDFERLLLDALGDGSGEITVAAELENGHEADSIVVTLVVSCQLLVLSCQFLSCQWADLHSLWQPRPQSHPLRPRSRRLRTWSAVSSVHGAVSSSRSVT